jgi:hypothetical protein
VEDVWACSAYSVVLVVMGRFNSTQRLISSYILSFVESKEIVFFSIRELKFA